MSRTDETVTGATAMQNQDVFHEGELALQERTGERASAIRNGVVISDTLLPSARAFLAQQRMVALASIDAQGHLSASLNFGKAGFVTSLDGQRVTIDRSLESPSPDDILWSNLQVGAELGMLAIELGTRRRVRINGVVSILSKDSITIAVREAFPNCPKYIQRRHLHETDELSEIGPTTEGGALTAQSRSTILQADTLFVASRHPERGADVSHRGGPKGFVRVVDDWTLRIPDYAGNGMFNTLGNFKVHSAAGLVIPDFERGRLLRLTGSVSTHFDEEDPRYPTGGTGRYWEFHVERWMESSAPAAYRWEFLDFSKYNPPPA